MDSDVDELAAALVRHCGAPPLASVEPVVEAVFLEFLEQFMEFTSPSWCSPRSSMRRTRSECCGWASSTWLVARI